MELRKHEQFMDDVKHRKPYVSIIKAILIILVVLGINYAAYTNIVVLEHKGFIFASIDDIDHVSTAIVFGGGMKDDGVTMSEMQEDRVKVAIALYQKKKVDTILFTGDDGANRFDEVSAMKQYALDHDIPEKDILIDGQGYRTKVSCDRAAREFNITEAIVVSQQFHLSRIIYLCKHAGIETGAIAADLRTYPHSFSVRSIREPLARIKAWTEVEVTKPVQVLEPFVGGG